jgi:hypothetical protein
MRALLLLAVVAGVVAVGFFACNPNAIGRPCVNPQGSAVRGTQITSPALECPSRLCLIQPPNASSGSTDTDGGSRATCSALCGSDDDCSAETTQFCKAGFVCAVATITGKYCCRKMCVCRDDLVAGVNQDAVDGGTQLPAACRDANGNLTRQNCPM